MVKRAKNVIAVLLAFTLICQTFWANPITEVQAEEDASASEQVYTAEPSDSEETPAIDNESQMPDDKQEMTGQEQQKQTESEKQKIEENRETQKEQDLKNQETEKKEAEAKAEAEGMTQEANAKAEAEEQFSGTDNTAPVVTGVTINDETTVDASIGTFEDISVGVHYKEEDSGLLSIRVEFYNENADTYENFYVNADDIDPNDYKGEGIIWVRQKAFRNLNDTYKLVNVSIEDNAGNSNYYYTDNSQMTDGDGALFAQASYTAVRESELDIVQMQSMKIVDSNGDPVNNMNVTAGDELYLEVEFINNTDEIVSISGIANWKSEDGWKNYSNDRNVQIDVHGTGTMKIQVPVFKYDNVEEWIMYDLDYYICDLNGYEIAHAYYYPEIEGQTGSYRYYEADQTFDFPWDIFGYNGEADYKVTNAPYADDTAPSIKGVTVNDEATIIGSAGTYGDVEIWVEYQEEKPGIDEISVVFETESGKEETFSLSVDENEEGKYAGTGTLQLKSNNFRELNDIYKLTYISVSDFAGNYRYYSADENGNMISSDSEETFEQASYEVNKEEKPDIVLINSMEIVDANGQSVDTSNVSAGDALFLKVLFDNNTKDNIRISMTGYWRSEKGDRTGNSDQFGNINANSQGTVLMEIPTSKYDSLGKWQLRDLDYFIYDRNENQIAYGYYYPELSDISQEYSYYYYQGDDSVSIPENLITYNGEGDYTIIEAPDADADSPVIKGITVNSDTETSAEIGTFDEVIFQVKYEELSSGIKDMSLGFQNNSGDMVWASIYEGETSEKQYVSDDGIITLSMKGFYELDDIYRLTGVSVSDYANNSVYYYVSSDGQMISDVHENTFPQVTFSATQEKDARLVLIKSMRLVDASGKDADNSNVSTDQELYLEVTYQNNTESDVRLSTSANWRSGEKDRWKSSNENITIPAGQSNTAVVEVPVSRYDSLGEWILYDVDYYMYDLDSNYLGSGYYYPDSSIGENYYNYYDNKNSFSIPMDLVDYNGEGNYIITDASHADETAPVINSVTIKNSNDPLKAEIGTLDDVQLDVQYTETVSGIQNIELRFRNSAGYTETFSEYFSEEEQYTGTGATLLLNEKALRELDDTYVLQYVYVTDFAGNSTTYYAEDGLLVPDSGSEEEEFEQPSYSVVRESETNMLLAEGVRLEKPDGTEVDKNNISAGESLVLVVAMNNTLDKDVSVVFNARWENQNNNSIYAQSTAGVRQSDNEKIEIRIPVEINRFCSVSSYAFSSLSYSIYDSEDRYVGGAAYDSYNNHYYLSNETIVVPEISNTSEADLYISVSDTPDEEAPYIKSVKTVTDSVSAPGTVELELTADTGYAKLTNVEFRIKDVTESKNNYYCQSSDLYYSVQRGCYVVTVDLDETVLAGTYQLYEISLYDEAGNYRYYSGSGDKLTDGNGNSCTADPIVVADSVETDHDFTSPKVQSIQLDKNSVSVPGEVKYTIKASDESGISKISLYYKTNGDEYLNIDIPVTKTGEDTWSGTAKLCEYATPGEYHVKSVYVYDGSIRMNSTLLTDEEEDFEHCSLNVKRAESKTIFISGTENEMKTQLQNVTKGSEVVYVSGPSAVAEYLPTSILQIIQDKTLKLLITSTDAETQILVDGADLTDEMTANPFYMNLGTYGYYEQNKIEFVNGYDTYMQMIGIYRPTGNTIPFVARWKLGQPLVEKALEQGNARMSEYSSQTDGYEIIKENLKITDDGYLELSSEDFADGSGEYAISTGTVKYFDYPLTVTAVPEISADTINKGISFDVQLSVTNNNKTAVNDVAVFAMLGTEDQCQWYTFESDDERVDIAGGDAVISSLGSGETVKLTAKFNIPKDTEIERAIITFIACSIGASEDEIISYGEDDLRLVLQDEETAIRGDMNLDGMVNSADLAYMLQYVNKRLSEDEVTKEQLQVGDVSRTDGQAIGTVNSSDLAKLLQYINHRIASLD